MKKKKLSLKQQHNMHLSTQKQSFSVAVEREVLLCAHQNRFLLCQDLKTKQLFQIHNNKRFQVVVGDKLIIGGVDDNNLKLLTVLPRRNTLQRLNDQQRAPLAANIDIACMVFSCQPQLWPQVLAQYRCYVKALKIPHLIIINKIDIGYPDQAWCERLDELKIFAQDSIIMTSVSTGQGIDLMKEHLEGKIAIFIGPSGVGKSSLIKCLIQDDSIRIGALSQSDRGAHTTSVTQYYSFNNIGLIDAPGVRQFSLESLSLTDLMQGFEDFKATKCKFNNCDHQHSQGCGVIDGLEKQLIGQHRYDDYLFLKKKFDL
jgi:ribosome biogenesis GTPase